MTEYTLATEIHRTFPETVAKVRDALAEQGFGVLTEIDISATLKTKLDVDLPPQLISGACRPELAYQALLADPSIAAILPCNVVVRSITENKTAVEALDPGFMSRLAEGDALDVVAQDASGRLKAMLEMVSEEN